MAATKNKIFLYLSFPLTILVAISAYCGIFIDGTYAGETENWRVQGIGQDLFDLFIIVPALIISGIFAYQNKKIAFFTFGGAVLFLVYSYAIYCFALHFNYLFLVYCLTFGLSVYSFVWFTAAHSANVVKTWFDSHVPVKLLAFILIFIAVLFYFLWLSEIIPAIMQHKTPKSLIGTGMLTNPVQVLDISLLLPGMIITSIFLLKRKPVGYLLTPVALVFCVLMSANIAGLAIFMKLKGMSDSLMIAEIMGIFVVFGLILLYVLFGHLKKASISL
ncbi:MAG TPA: hypothetical protein VIM16_02165 [Mucilaginibacter sp.]|jgi:hypothetical protein